jgi:hypothetical protein
MGRLLALSGLAATFLLASMASSTSAAPLADRFHGTISDTFPDSICGIDGTSVFSAVFNVQIFADETSQAELRVSQLFTSAATGKSVLIFSADQFTRTGPPVDNGDGTITFTDTSKGLMEQLKLPNGTVLSRDAGFVTIDDTFNATTGDFLGETISPENGPHPDLDSGFALFCDVIVPALLT